MGHTYLDIYLQSVFHNVLRQKQKYYVSSLILCTENEDMKELVYDPWYSLNIQEPRKKLLQSTKLKPIIIGVGSQGVLRVDPKTKEVLDTWHYSCLRNWAYSKRTFVLVSTHMYIVYMTRGES